MELAPFFKSVLEQDNTAIVLCDLAHNIIYMNPAADAHYGTRGGHDLVGRSIFGCHPEPANDLIRKVVDWFAADKAHNRVHTFFNEKQQKDVYMIALRDDAGELIGYYEKHEYRTIDPTPMYQLD